MNKKTNHKSTGIILIIASILFLAIAAIIYFFSQKEVDDNQSSSLFDVTAEKEPCSIDATFLSDTEPYAAYDANEDIGFYFAMDSDNVVYIVCMHKADLPKYEALVSENPTATIPMSGVSMVIDDELKSYTIDYFNSVAGSEIMTDSNFNDYVGYYYLYLGENPAVVPANRSVLIASAFGVLLLLAGIVQLMKSKKQPLETTADYNATVNTTAFPSLEVPVINHGAGIVGAILGSIVGSIPWVILGHIGYVSAWFGLLIIYAAIWGYRKLGGGITLFGKLFSGFCALIMVLVSEFVEYAWAMADSLSEIMPGHASFLTTLLQLPQYLASDAELLHEFQMNLVLGYVFVLLGLFYFIIQKKSIDSVAKKELRNFPIDKKLRQKRILLLIPMIIFLFASIMYAIRSENFVTVIGSLIIFIAIWTVIFRKVSSVKLSTNFKGFLYGDGVHQSKKLILWDTIQDVKEPSAIEPAYQILTKDGTTYLINHTVFEQFDDFIALLKEKIHTDSMTSLNGEAF